ncbi:Hypothetical protein GbCGDNIH4_1696 [Granulibacter bethesdensis CGDNIH4]|nr:Hypothetical protein GbCGDNIH4_1696 [Granulibacter bethesdensis CGDNIH4]
MGARYHPESRMMRWLVLQWRAPLASFGGTTIDSRGVTRDFPALSAVTGLLANALGLDRTDTTQLDRLQERIVFGARREQEPLLGRMTDFQTALLGNNDRGWTTRGRVEGRDGASNAEASTHIRQRDYHADMQMTVVLHLTPAEEAPTLDDIAKALLKPARPLFFGRKPCLPADYVLAAQEENRWVEAEDARAALIAIPGEGLLRAQWSAAPGKGKSLADRRNWRSGLHGGTRRVEEERITPVTRR